MAENACESGVGLRSRPRIAKQSRKSRETADQACLNLTASGFFIGPRRLFAVPHRLNWRKLLESVTKPVRQEGCPEGPSGPFGEVFEGE